VEAVAEAALSEAVVALVVIKQEQWLFQPQQIIQSL
jgi:hypothetical protein